MQTKISQSYLSLLSYHKIKGLKEQTEKNNKKKKYSEIANNCHRTQIPQLEFETPVLGAVLKSLQFYVYIAAKWFIITYSYSSN